ncbi:hypothetical protein HY441_02120 [Candidatus Microgenomates bacterium]|nr:hypothetical protein [Candidatus Microgenomates bacterium]
MLKIAKKQEARSKKQGRGLAPSVERLKFSAITLGANRYTLWQPEVANG